MMNLMHVIERDVTPVPWQEGDNIPWDDPAFSRRMLTEHLCQDHDAASRRFEKIDEQVRWIHGELLAGRPTNVLELACGPGLYTSRLAKLGHECVGIDYAPAAVAHAKGLAHDEDLACTYRLEDVREAEYGRGFGLVMMIYGQFNVFRRDEARKILDKAFAALAGGGLLLLEPQKLATVEGEARKPPTWWSVPGGMHLFAEGPHLCLEEHFWDAEAATGTTRYFVIDPATGNVSRQAMSVEAYSDEEFRTLLANAGFENIELFPSLIGIEDKSHSYNIAITARKPTAHPESRDA